MAKKCTYDYEVIKLVALAMESRLVTNKTRTLEEAKMVMQDVYTLLSIMANDKKLTLELKAEGAEAHEQE